MFSIKNDIAPTSRKINPIRKTVIGEINVYRLTQTVTRNTFATLPTYFDYDDYPFPINLEIHKAKLYEKVPIDGRRVVFKDRTLKDFFPSGIERIANAVGYQYFLQTHRLVTTLSDQSLDSVTVILEMDNLFFAKHCAVGIEIIEKRSSLDFDAPEIDDVIRAYFADKDKLHLHAPHEMPSLEDSIDVETPCAVVCNYRLGDDGKHYQDVFVVQHSENTTNQLHALSAA